MTAIKTSLYKETEERACFLFVLKILLKPLFDAEQASFVSRPAPLSFGEGQG